MTRGGGGWGGDVNGAWSIIIVIGGGSKFKVGGGANH